MRKSQTARSTIKNDPFASVIPLPDEEDIPEPADRLEPEPAPPAKSVSRRPGAANTDSAVAATAQVASKAGRQKLTVHLPAALAERVKNAAYWNPRLTIAGIAEQGIKHAIDKFERENGGPYPARDGELVGGRPIK